MSIRMAISLLLTPCLLACGDAEPPASGTPSGSGTGEGARDEGAAVGLEASRQIEEMPNVVVILIDTLRADHIPAYGYDRKVAPFLARLSRRSVVFQNAYSSSSWTGPATASLFTGLYPTRHGLTRGFHAQGGVGPARQEEEPTAIELRPLPEQIATLPQLYRSLGYSTWGYAANINIGTELGFDRGFDEFQHKRKESVSRISEVVKEWLPRMKTQSPYFLYLHLNDVHKPNTPMQPWYQKAEDELQNKLRLYDSEISYVDHELEQMYRSFGWDEDTLLILVSDHGEEFQDHGGSGHGYSLYQELMKVVMFVHAPGLMLDGKAVVEPGVVEANVSLVDVVPTIVDLAGATLPEARDGRSLRPLLGSGRDDGAATPFHDRYVFGHRLKREEDRELFAVLWREWKLIHDVTKETDSLFNLREDPGERNDVRIEHLELVSTLRAALDTLRAHRSLRGGTIEVQLDAATLEHLEVLGYFDPDPEKKSRKNGD